MRPEDALGYSYHALRAYPGRTSLILLAMAIGVASVITLTSLGEGARSYVANQFSAMGSNLLAVLPGRNETVGGMPPMLGTIPRDLTLEDARALARSPLLRAVAPVSVGAAPVSHGGLEREVTVVGTTAEMFGLRELEMRLGRFLPAGDWRRTEPVCVLGDELWRELFRGRNPVGRWLRIGEARCRVIGLLAPGGTALHMDMSDTVLIPVASAMELFDAPSLFRIVAGARSEADLERARREILRILRARHDGEEDVTVITQDALSGAFDEILATLTWFIGGIAAISLVVAGILIMNVMLVSVSQRRAEVGLLKALGASTRTVMALFLTEALQLALAGGTAGMAGGLLANLAISRWLPDFPVHVPAWAAPAALLVTVVTGLLFGGIPARRAARLDPVAALAKR